MLYSALQHKGSARRAVSISQALSLMGNVAGKEAARRQACAQPCLPLCALDSAGMHMLPITLDNPRGSLKK